jgi:hypothetical protein
MLHLPSFLQNRNKAEKNRSKPIIMIQYLYDRLLSYIPDKDVVNSDFKSYNESQSTKEINYHKTRGSVRLLSQSVLTRNDIDQMVDDILKFNFGK